MQKRSKAVFRQLPSFIKMFFVMAFLLQGLDVQATNEVGATWKVESYFMLLMAGTFFQEYKRGDTMFDVMSQDYDKSGKCSWLPLWSAQVNESFMVYPLTAPSGGDDPIPPTGKKETISFQAEWVTEEEFREKKYVDMEKNYFVLPYHQSQGLIEIGYTQGPLDSAMERVDSSINCLNLKAQSELSQNLFDLPMGFIKCLYREHFRDDPDVEILKAAIEGMQRVGSSEECSINGKVRECYLQKNGKYIGIDY